jgi:hypothetical protein
VLHLASELRRGELAQVGIPNAFWLHADPAVKATANAIVAWIKARANRIVFNDAPSFGSIGPEFKDFAN